MNKLKWYRIAYYPTNNYVQGGEDWIRARNKPIITGPDAQKFVVTQMFSRAVPEWAKDK